MGEMPPLDASVVLWSAEKAQRADRPLLVMLHGYGADERDLFGLAPYLPDEFVLAAPRAMLPPPWPAPGFAWFSLDTPAFGDVSAAASHLVDWVDAESDASVVGLLGFSQGAAVAHQAMRLHPGRFAFAVNLSGFVSPGALDGDAELAERRPPVFWGRGTRDEVIPEHLVLHTTEWLPAHSELSGRVYPGLTHSVSEQELADVRRFLDKRLDEAGDPQPR